MKNTTALISCTLILLSFALLFTACRKADKTDSLAPGLYNKENDLISSWDALVTNYGFDVERDYTYDTHPESPSCILSDNSELSQGVTLVIGDVTKIGNLSFKFCETLSTVIIPDSVTSIGNEAFWFCSSLKTIKLGRAITSIGDSAFTACTSLKSISIPESVTYIGNGAFQRCSSLESITLSDSIEIIHSSLFSSCENLKSVKMGNKVKSICFNAFSGTALESINIPKSVSLIESEAFSGCQSLTDITFGGTISEWSLLDSGNLASSVPATVIKCTNGNVSLK
ncbi:MAG: leucine-rich repeat domain-containing protein [Clostridia bacterium]|nr:leucine-rich repeat domain-containing protein [Clostridia bacterium]